MRGAGAQVFERVLVQPRDAGEASDVFYKQNTGDVLLNYENEVIFTNLQYGEADAMPYVVPNNNVRVRAGHLMASLTCRRLPFHQTPYRSKLGCHVLSD